MATETVSFRLRKDLKDLARRYKVDIAKIAKEKVEEEIERLQKEERKETLGKAAKVLAKMTREDIVAAVRKSRESR